MIQHGMFDNVPSIVQARCTFPPDTFVRLLNERSLPLSTAFVHGKLEWSSLATGEKKSRIHITTTGSVCGTPHLAGVEVSRVTILLNSRSQSTELATTAQRSQSLKLKLAVENACCKNGT